MVKYYLEYLLLTILLVFIKIDFAYASNEYNDGNINNIHIIKVTMFDFGIDKDYTLRIKS